MARNVHIIITNDIIAEKLYEIFDKEKINAMVFPNCKGYQQKGSLFEFLGFTNNKVCFMAFMCDDRKRKIILKYLYLNYNQKNNGIMFSIKGGVEMQVKNKMLVCVVNNGYGEKVADILRKEGPCGATILSGRGSGVDFETFMGMSLESDREIVVSVMPAKLYPKMKKSLKDAFVDDATDVVCFSLPITNFDKLHK